MTFFQRSILIAIAAASFSFATLFGFLVLDWVLLNGNAFLGFVGIPAMLLMGTIAMKSTEAALFDRW